MATASNRIGERINPIPIAQLANEVLSPLKPPGGDQPTFREVERVFGGLRQMGNIEMSSELVPTPDFLLQLLDVLGGSTNRKSVSRRLVRLANIIDYAVVARHLEPSEIVLSRPLAIPPEWDEDDKRFARGGTLAPVRRPVHFPAPGWRDFRRVMIAMAAESFAWPTARLYVLCSTVVLARLNWSEALAIQVKDYRPDDGGLYIAQRARLRKGRPEAINPIEISPPLSEVWERWIPRIHCGYAFPLLSRSGPLQRPTASCDLAEFAIRILGTGDSASRFTPGGLLAFGIAHKDRLWNPKYSPFSIHPNDNSTLMPRVVPLASLKEKIISKKMATTNNYAYLKIFGDISKIPEVNTVSDLVPAIAEKLISAAGITDPIRKTKGGKPFPRFRMLRAICRYGIELGAIDHDPLIGRPETPIRQRKPLDPKPEGLRTRRYLFKAAQLLALSRETAAQATFPEAAKEPPSPLEPSKGKRPDPALWIETREELDREIENIESKATREVVSKLIGLMPDRPTGKLLLKVSGHSDAVNLLKAFADSGSRLARAVGIPGPGKIGYWILIEIVKEPHS
jgi:hypothetical protein